MQECHFLLSVTFSLTIRTVTSQSEKTFRPKRKARMAAGNKREKNTLEFQLSIFNYNTTTLINFNLEIYFVSSHKYNFLTYTLVKAIYGQLLAIFINT